MIRTVISAGVFASLLATPVLADVNSQDTGRVWQADRSGQPASEIDMAVKTQSTPTMDFRSEPRFSRSLEEQPSIDSDSLKADIQGEVRRALKATPFFKPGLQ